MNTLHHPLPARVSARLHSIGDGAPNTVNELALRFIDGHLKAKVRARWSQEAERILRVEVMPRIGGFPLKRLKRTDLTGLVERKAAALHKSGGKGVAANRLSAVLSKLCSFGASRGWLARDIGRSLPKPAREQSRERTLTAAEMGDLWNALNAARDGSGLILPVHARILGLLALTGCRCSEIAGLTVKDVDLNKGMFRITGGKTRASVRNLPICPLARAIFEEQRRTISSEAYDALLFPSPRAGKVIPSKDMSRWSHYIVLALEQPPWTPHDLRRTFTAILAENGIPDDVARHITGHQGSEAQERAHDRAACIDDMRVALQAVEDWVVAAAANVMEIAGRIEVRAAAAEAQVAEDVETRAAGEDVASITTDQDVVATPPSR